MSSHSSLHCYLPIVRHPSSDLGFNHGFSFIWLQWIMDGVVKTCHIVALRFANMPSSVSISFSGRLSILFSINESGSHQWSPTIPFFLLGITERILYYVGCHSIWNKQPTLSYTPPHTEEENAACSLSSYPPQCRSSPLESTRYPLGITGPFQWHSDTPSLRTPRCA